MLAVAFVSMLAISLDATGFESLLEQSFYPVLFLVFVVASLGLPIPEDIPLIAAGMVLATQSPESPIASWPLTIAVSLVGIMSGDIVLYSMGRRWGRNVFEHRFVSWLMTPARMEAMTDRFHRWGMWACFFGRFMMGVRAIMCLTAGVTRFPFWKFFLADFCGALLSAPFFIMLGYLFAGMLDQMKPYLVGFKTAIAVLVVLVIAAVIWFEVRRMRKIKAESDAALRGMSSAAAGAGVAESGVAADAPARIAETRVPHATASPKVG